MTLPRPQAALARLTEALEAEILAAPEPELRGLVADAGARASLQALRALVARAVEAAEEGGDRPPDIGTEPMHRRL
jgi:hypothetical protein